MFGNASSAKVKDGRLVMSMPDAETPVVWVMDLGEASTSVLRLESDKQGLYVIKKHGGKVAETVAVYRNRRPAVKALTRATKAMDRARTYRGQGTSRLTNVLLVVLLVWFALSRLWGLDQDLMRMAILPFVKDDLIAMAQQAQALQQQAAAAASGTQNTQAANPNAMGVPLSADEALQAEQDKAGRLLP
ncbi:MAG TPA: hypothetical protein VIN59_05425 [Alphaproteobacteria bacterium]